jgi:hypothetical protein
MKGPEMTVLRTVRLVEAFDDVPKGGDWRDVPTKTYKNILGDDHYQMRNVLDELWKRYKSGTLFREITDLARNLPLKDIKKENPERAKEIQRGIARANT